MGNAMKTNFEKARQYLYGAWRNALKGITRRTWEMFYSAIARLDALEAIAKAAS